MNGTSILGMRVDATSYDDATARILEWAAAGESRYVCAANVHMVMETVDSDDFRGVVNGADLVTPDGMPLVWLLRRDGFPDQPRVYGPDLMLHVCAAAERNGVPVGLYGGLPEVVTELVRRLRQKFPALSIPFVESPPFRPPSAEEGAAVVARVKAAGARILFIGLGCPKQERWMAANRPSLPAVMVGVGAAFDFHAGVKRQAPAVMQRAGLEWLFRLATEPRRLGRRYLVQNPRFVARVVKASLQRRRR